MPILVGRSKVLSGLDSGYPQRQLQTVYYIFLIIPGIIPRQSLSGVTPPTAPCSLREGEVQLVLLRGAEVELGLPKVLGESSCPARGSPRVLAENGLEELLRVDGGLEVPGAPEPVGAWEPGTARATSGKGVAEGVVLEKKIRLSYRFYSV